MAESKHVMSEEVFAHLLEMIDSMSGSERERLVDAGVKCVLMVNHHLFDLVSDCSLLLAATRLGPDNELLRDVLKGREREFDPKSVSAFIVGVESAVASQICHEIEMPYDEDEGFDDAVIAHMIEVLDKIITEMAVDFYKHVTGRKE